MKRPKEQKQKVLKGLTRRQPFGLFLSLLSLLSLSARAGFLSSESLTSSDVGKTLEDGKAYVVSDSADLITQIETAMDRRNSINQQTMIELQSATSKRDQAYDMISNMLKSLHTVMTGIVNNT